MFEKEAEEKTAQYMKEHTEKYNCENTKLETDNYNTGLEQGYEKGFKDGAEFGYNKANEWHYVKDGDLPKEDTAEKETLYLLWGGLDDSDYLTGIFSHGRFWCFDSGWFETNEVVAWKEMIPPKE